MNLGTGGRNSRFGFLILRRQQSLKARIVTYRHCRETDQAGPCGPAPPNSARWAALWSDYRRRGVPVLAGSVPQRASEVVSPAVSLAVRVDAAGVEASRALLLEEVSTCDGHRCKPPLGRTITQS